MSLRYRLPTSPLQEKLIARLTVDLADTTVALRLYDQPPEGSAYPLVLVGNFHIERDGAKDVVAMRIRGPIEIWSEAEGMEEVQGLADRLCQSVTRDELPFSDSNFNNFGVQFETCDYDRRPGGGDRILRLATLVFTWFVQDVS